MFKRTLIAAILMSSFTVSTAFADVVVSVSHEVKDFATWKKGFDGDKAMRKKAGFKDLYVAQDIAKPDRLLEDDAGACFRQGVHRQSEAERNDGKMRRN